MRRLLGARSTLLMQSPCDAKLINIDLGNQEAQLGDRSLCVAFAGRMLSSAKPCKGMGTMAFQETSAHCR